MERGLVDDPQDGSPSWDEVEQREELPELPVPAVAVHVDGPVQVHNLPSRTSILRTIYIDSTPTELLAEDLRRARAVIASGTDIVIGLTRGACLTNGAEGKTDGLQWDTTAYGVLELRGTAQLWVAAPSVAPGAAQVGVSILAESWAD